MQPVPHNEKLPISYLCLKACYKWSLFPITNFNFISNSSDFSNVDNDPPSFWSSQLFSQGEFSKRSETLQGVFGAACFKKKHLQPGGPRSSHVTGKNHLNSYRVSPEKSCDNV